MIAQTMDQSNRVDSMTLDSRYLRGKIKMKRRKNLWLSQMNNKKMMMKKKMRRMMMEKIQKKQKMRPIKTANHKLVLRLNKTHKWLNQNHFWNKRLINNSLL